MRHLPFEDRSFDWILNFFTAFGYFEEERENFRVLEEVFRILTPGGSFLIDFFNAARVVRGLKAREALEQGARRVEIERWFDPGAKRINKRIRIHDPGRPPRVFLESVRAYDAEELACGMRWAGLTLDHLYGGFAGEPYEHDSERLIIIGHRPS